MTSFIRVILQVCTETTSNLRLKKPGSTRTTCRNAIHQKWISAMEATKYGRTFGGAAKGSGSSKRCKKQKTTSPSLKKNTSKQKNALEIYKKITQRNTCILRCLF